MAAFIFIAAKLRHGRVALKHLDAIFAISRQPRPESPQCAQDEAASDRGGAEIMAGLCTNHVVVVAVVSLYFFLFSFRWHGFGQRTLVRTSKDHVRRARDKSTAQRSQRGLKSRPTHACKLKRC